MTLPSPVAPQARAPVAARSAALPVPRIAPSPAPVETLDIFDAAEPVAAPPPALASAPALRSVRRPLIELFPPSALEAEQPPFPALGTAVGPQLPPQRPRRVPAPASAPIAHSATASVKPVSTPSPLDAPTYETFYGLRERAFTLSTDPKFHYQSAAHELASQGLHAAIRKRTGVAVLTGALGTGKTTLCRALVQELDRRTVTSLVLGPVASIDDLLKTMLADFGVISREDLAGSPSVAREVLTRTLKSFLDSLVSLQAGAVVIIDEAQNLPVAVLQEIGALLAAAPGPHPLQVVLVGQPALTTLLKRSELRPMNASVTRRLALGPLGADEIAGYVMHRLSVAGGNTRVEFDEAAIARLFALSAGVARVVNVLCDRALTRGQQTSAAVIDARLINDAAADLDIDVPRGDADGLAAKLVLAVTFAALVAAGATAALWVSRDAVGRAIIEWQHIPAAPRAPLRDVPALIAPIPPPEISGAPASAITDPPADDNTRTDAPASASK